ncbi:MAG TPA: hypothetical protein VFB62_10305 [Polyangiaceae bacterium]|jgi:hypothetical protein|nr:hypothetical protein [Polyangiaceae bacterium]
MADFPNAQESDSDDVRWALETALTMWNQGDKQEALKWLRRAAESAEQSGDDMRSLMLAKARAELHSLVEHDESETGPTPLASPVSLGTPMPPASTPPGGRTSSRPGSGAPAQSSPPGGHISRPPSRPAPPPKRVSTAGMPSARTPLGGPPPSGRGDEESRQTLINANRAPLPQPSMTRGPMDERRAIRVAVQPVEGQPGVFLTRPLRPGERPAPGASEAILVSIEPGADPLGR